MRNFKIFRITMAHYILSLEVLETFYMISLVVQVKLLTI